MTMREPKERQDRQDFTGTQPENLFFRWSVWRMSIHRSSRGDMAKNERSGLRTSYSPRGVVAVTWSAMFVFIHCLGDEGFEFQCITSCPSSSTNDSLYNCRYKVCTRYFPPAIGVQSAYRRAVWRRKGGRLCQRRIRITSAEWIRQTHPFRFLLDGWMVIPSDRVMYRRIGASPGRKTKRWKKVNDKQLFSISRSLGYV